MLYEVGVRGQACFPKNDASLMTTVVQATLLHTNDVAAESAWKSSLESASESSGRSRDAQASDDRLQDSGREKFCNPMSQARKTLARHWPTDSPDSHNVVVEQLAGEPKEKHLMI